MRAKKPNESVEDWLWPITLENAYSTWPRTLKNQRHAILVYKCYIARYEKTFSKQDAMAYTRRKFGCKESIVNMSLAFTRALIRAMKEQEQVSQVQKD